MSTNEISRPITKVAVMANANDIDALLEVSILRRRDEAEGIVSLELAGLDGMALPAFDAGAHVDVHIAPGLVRQYSLCSNSADTRTYRLAVLLETESRGGSAEIHKAFTAGRTIRISRPRNNFSLAAQAKRIILLAGGIGVTPLLAMAYRLDALEVPFELHYCTRRRGRAAFIQDIAASRFAAHVYFHYGDGPAVQRLDLDRDLPPPADGTHIYVCGPSGFITWCIEGAGSRGWPKDHFHKEYFANQTNAEGDSFIVEARKSGKSVQVACGTTIVDALASIGVIVPISCEQGVCGTCLTDVIEGVPDHRDMYQTDAERAVNNKITPCCSRALTPILVLDI